MRAPPHRSLAQAPQAVALARRASFAASLVVVGMQQVPLLDGQQEDEPVDEAQELVEVVLSSRAPALQRRSQRCVLRVREEALAQRDERLLDAASQMLRARVPSSRPASRQVSSAHSAAACPSRPKRVSCSEQPERREVGVALLGEDALAGRPRSTRAA